MDAEFSLLDDAWIVCSMKGGSTRSLSLRQVFDGSADPIEVLGDSPTQDYAVLRVLLAVFWRAHRHEAQVRPGETFDFDEWFDDAFAAAKAGGADNEVLDYLDRFEDRFHLLDGTQPFMQVASLHTSKDSHSPIHRIIPEAETDFFAMRAGKERESLSLAEATRWLVHTHAYDYSGIKSGAVGDPRVKGGRGYPIGTGWAGATGGTVILGADLRETLVLNTVSACLCSGDEDAPVWERTPDGPAEREDPYPHGPSDLATWQSRRIRLFVENGRATGVLVANGDKIPDAGKDILSDPMTPYRFSKNQTKKNMPPVYYARPYDTERMMWRSLEPLIALTGEQEREAYPPIRPANLTSLAEIESPLLSSAQRLVDLRLISASYGPQSSTLATTVDARIDIPRALLSRSNAPLRLAVLDTARTTQAAAIAVGRFAGALLVAAGDTYSFQPSATDALLAELEPEFRRWLAHITEVDLIDALTAWQALVAEASEQAAQTLLRGAGSRALIGRETTTSGAPEIHSAGTAYRKLRNELRKTLPLAPQHQQRKTNA